MSDNGAEGTALEELPMIIDTLADGTIVHSEEDHIYG